MKAHEPRHLGLALAWAFLAALPATAQQADWRTSYAAGDEARRSRDWEGYAQAMASAVEAMEAGLLNRPFAQYHAARAHALAGRPVDAVAFLRMAWDEGIEALMISFAHHDPAFDGMRDDPELREVLGRARGMRLEATPLGGSTYLITGAGSSVVASVGPDGVLLVDTGYGAALPALLRTLGQLGGRGVDVVVLTHPHEDHWGGVAELAVQATVIAHPATAEAMVEPYEFMPDVVLPPKPEVARPDAAVRDTTFVFNGERVRIVGVEAHTGADLAVHFEGSGVLHLGDTYLGGNPMIFPGAEDPDGFLDGLETFLDALAEDTRVIGGHDPPTDLDAVRHQIAETRGCMALVRDGIARGLSAEQVVREAEGRYAAPWVGYFHRLFSAQPAR